MSKPKSETTIEKEKEKEVEKVEEPIVKCLNQNDVFLGRGGNLWRKEGNNRLRNICQQWNHRYSNVPKAKKPMIAKTIVDQVKAMDPPGRFLRKHCESSNISDIAWVEVDDDVATEKVSQVLRDIRRIRRSRNSKSAITAPQSPVLISPYQYQHQYSPYDSANASNCTSNTSALTSYTDDRLLVFGTSPSSPPPSLMVPSSLNDAPFFPTCGETIPSSLLVPSSLNEAPVFPTCGDTRDGSSDRSAYFSSSNSGYGTRYKEDLNTMDGRALPHLHQSSHQMNRGAMLNYPPSSPQPFSSTMEREQDRYRHQYQRHGSNGRPQGREVLSFLHGRNNIPGITRADQSFGRSNRHSLPNNAYIPAPNSQQQYYNYKDCNSAIHQTKKNHLQQQQQPQPHSAANMESMNTSYHSQSRMHHNYPPPQSRHQYNEENGLYQTIM